jgi:hypothetical protein
MKTTRLQAQRWLDERAMVRATLGSMVVDVVGVGVSARVTGGAVVVGRVNVKSGKAY